MLVVQKGGLLKTLASNSIVKVILTYFVVALIIFLSAYPFPRTRALSEVTVPVLLSIFLLIPIYIWQRNYTAREKHSKEINGRNKMAIIFWILILFILALSVRIPSVLLFDMPYEKTTLIYLIILTIVVMEKTDVSAFGFKTQNIGKSLFYGLIFFVVLGGTMLSISYLLVYAFINQTVMESFNIMPFLLAMPFHTLCVGISEEGFFRGYMQTHLEKFYTSKKAIFVQAILFGVWHFVWNLSPFDPLGMAMYVADTFFYGLLYGYFYSKARNLVPLVFAHGLSNSVTQGIITNEAALDALQAIPISNQVLILLLPYAILSMLTFLFIRYLVKEI